MEGGGGFDSFKDVYSWMGFAGGLLFPLASVAQLYKMVATKSAMDVSYEWVIIYFTAEVFYLVFAAHFRLWPIIIPVVIEIVVLLTILPTKFYFDNYGPKSIKSRGLHEVKSSAVVKGGEVPMSLRNRSEKGTDQVPATPTSGDRRSVMVIV